MICQLPLVSIITPCYNADKFIDQTINSVKAQTYTNWELVVVDDASTDDTLAVLEKYALTDNRIVLIRLIENKGIANARNRGIEIARGKYIAFLDSDDLWKQDKLKIQIDFMQTNNYSLSHTGYEKINYRGHKLSRDIVISDKVKYSDLLKHNEMACLTVMYNVEKVGKKYFSKIGHEDYAYWLDILKITDYSYGLNTVLASYRVHSKSVSYNKIKAALFTWNIYRKHEKFNLLRSLYFFINYAIKSTLKFLN